MPARQWYEVIHVLEIILTNRTQIKKAFLYLGILFSCQRIGQLSFSRSTPCFFGIVLISIILSPLSVILLQSFAVFLCPYSTDFKIPSFGHSALCLVISVGACLAFRVNPGSSRRVLIEELLFFYFMTFTALPHTFRKSPKPVLTQSSRH